uniref:Ycf34 n=1 Tax=Gracilaria hainanensis TaxID=2871843 RepID=A0AAU7YRF5_9FLOR
MCICVNCRHVQNCITYHLIQKQHNDRYNKKIISNYFIPKETLININIDYIDKNTSFDWDLIECLSFVEIPGYWIR